MPQSESTPRVRPKGRAGRDFALLALVVAVAVGGWYLFGIASDRLGAAREKQAITQAEQLDAQLRSVFADLAANDRIWRETERPTSTVEAGRLVDETGERLDAVTADARRIATSANEVDSQRISTAYVTASKELLDALGKLQWASENSRALAEVHGSLGDASERMRDATDRMVQAIDEAQARRYDEALSHAERAEALSREALRQYELANETCDEPLIDKAIAEANEAVKFSTEERQLIQLALDGSMAEYRAQLPQADAERREFEAKRSQYPSAKQLWRVVTQRNGTSVRSTGNARTAWERAQRITAEAR